MRELCYASTELGRSTLQQVFFPHLFFAVEHFQSLTSYAFRLRLDVCSDDDDEHTIWRSKPSALFQYRISARRLWVSLRFPPLVSTVAVYIISFVSLSLLLAGVRLIGIINYKIIIVSVLWLPRNVWSSFFFFYWIVQNSYVVLEARELSVEEKTSKGKFLNFTSMCFEKRSWANTQPETESWDEFQLISPRDSTRS